jgi:hypothetical protein
MLSQELNLVAARRSLVLKLHGARWTRAFTGNSFDASDQLDQAPEILADGERT